MGVLEALANTIALPERIVELARREAKKLGLGLEEYLAELVIQQLNPKNRAVEYIEVAKKLLEEAKKELEKGNIQQAAEKAWGTTALAIKAYAWWKENKRLTSHRELWEYKDIVAEDLGKWVRDSWNAGISMYTCFYENWCTRKDVEENIEKIEKLVKEVEARIRENKNPNTIPAT